MDDSPTLEATGLFSPSKARVQQAQAKDWAVVDTWLARKYGTSKRLPSFERNEETLQALLSLAAINDAADEQRDLIEKVEKMSLQAFEAKQNQTRQELTNTLVKHMDVASLETLQTLVESSLMLGASDAKQMGGRIFDLTTEVFEADQNLTKAKQQHDAMMNEQTRLRDYLSSLKSDAYKPDLDLPEKTSNWARSAKQLKLKVAEYDERLKSIRPRSGPQSRMQDVSTALEELNSLRDRLRVVEAEFAAYQALPIDANLAKAKVQEAQNELHRVTQERDALFQKMVSE